MSAKKILLHVNHEFDRRVADPKTGAKNFDVIPLGCHILSRTKKFYTYFKHDSFQCSVLFIPNYNSVVYGYLCINAIIFSVASMRQIQC